MSEEIFDIVNERDEVIGRQPRRVVHAQGLLHRAVHVLVFNARGEIFLQKRSLKKDRQPGVWDSSASGHVDSGEHYDATALRELREEIGLDLENKNLTQRRADVKLKSSLASFATLHETTAPLQKLFKINACAETDAEFVWIYRCENDGPFVLQPDEIETGDWFAPDAVTQWMCERPQNFASAFRLIWKKLFGDARGQFS